MGRRYNAPACRHLRIALSRGLDGPAMDRSPSQGGRAMIKGIYHIGIQADDPAQLAHFYHDVLDMEIIGGSGADNAQFGASAFLSSRPDEESHHLAIFQRRMFAHMAFKVGSL